MKQLRFEIQQIVQHRPLLDAPLWSTDISWKGASLVKAFESLIYLLHKIRYKMASETLEQKKQIRIDSINYVFDSTKSLLSNFRKNLSGYIEKVGQVRLAETSQYDDTDRISQYIVISLKPTMERFYQ